MTVASSGIKGLTDTNNVDSIWKKPIRISDNMTVVAIPESVVQQLHIDEQRTWFQVIVTSEGEIILKIFSKEIG